MHRGVLLVRKDAQKTAAGALWDRVPERPSGLDQFEVYDRPGTAARPSLQAYLRALAL